MIAFPSSLRGRILLATALLVIIANFLIPASSRPHITASFEIPARFRSTKTLLDDTLNRTLGFEKIFAITLPSRTDHLDAIALAAALTGLDIDIIDGVDGHSVPAKALPPDSAAAHLSPGSIGSWRAHLNALRTVVQQNLSSALILEGDVDWDIRIKPQMRTFALASRMLLQPLLASPSNGNPEKFLDPTFPHALPGQTHQDFPLTADNLVQEPLSSPYADLPRWDVLWLGHCGAEFPQSDGHSSSVPLGRIVIADDDTVAETQHLEPEWGSAEHKTAYANHTRLVSRARMNVCSLAYAVSQQGARKLLYEIGLKSFTENYDLLLRYACDGSAGRGMAVCLTVQPPLFEHHRPVGPLSKVSDLAVHEGWNEEAFTVNVRWSARVNLGRLAQGETEYIDTLPDGEPGRHLADR